MEKKSPLTRSEMCEAIAEGVMELCRRPSINRMPKLLSLLSSDSMDMLQQDIPAKERVVYNLLQLPEKYRGGELLALLERLLSGMDSVEKMRESYSNRSVEELCKGLRSSYEPAGRHLIKIGEESDRLYFILKGQVLVLYPRSAAEVDRQSIGRDELRGMSKQQYLLSEYEEKFPFRSLPLKLVENYQNLFNSSGVPLYQVEATLVKGQSFGELGIIYTQRRMAHIICGTDCQFGSLTAEQYLHIISNKWQAGRIHSKLLFLEKHFYSGLGELDMRQAQRFVYMFSAVQFKVNSHIVQLHSPIRGAYILVQGSIVVKRQSTSMENYATEVSDLNFLLNTNHKKKNLHEVKKLVTGDCLGLTELITNNGASQKIFYQYQATAVSNCKLLYCPANKLLKALTEDSKLEDQLKTKAKAQLKLLKEAPRRPSTTNDNQKQSNPSRYYLRPSSENTSAIDRVLRSVSREKSNWACDRTYEPPKYQSRKPSPSCTRTTGQSPMNQSRRVPSSIGLSVKPYFRRAKLPSTSSRGDSSLGLMRMSTTNIKRILSDPFSYY